MPVLCSVACNWRTWLLACLLCGIVATAFWPCLSNALVRDDADLVDNTHLSGAGCYLGWMLTTFHAGRYQPLTWASLRLDRGLWGLNPRGYHAVNLALHVLNCVLVYLLGLALLAAAQRLATGQPPACGHYAGAWLAALLFGLHPLRVEAVAWASQRGVLLSTLFLLLSLLLYVRATTAPGRGLCLMAAVVCCALSLAAGPIGLTLPIILLLLDWYPLRRLGGGDGRWFGPAVRGVWLEKVPFVLLAGAAAVAAAAARARVPTDGDATVVERLAQMAYGPGLYLLKTLWPIDLVPFYETRWLPEWASVEAIGSLAALAGLIVLLARFGRGTPALTTTIVACLVLLLPVPALLHSGYEAAADRYSYLPCIAWVLLAGGGIGRLWNTPGKPARCAAGVVTTLGMVIAGGLGVLTWQHCRVWHDAFTVWTYTAQKRPESGIAWYMLGRQFAQAAEPERAQQLFGAAINCRPKLLPAYYGQGTALLELSRPGEAVQVYGGALKIDPQRARTHFLLGVALAADDRFGPAEESLRRAIALDPNAVAPHGALGHLLIVLQRWDEAADAFRGAAALDPHNADVMYDLGRAYQRGGHPSAAVDAFRRALAIDPQHRLARRALAEMETLQPSPAEAPD